MRGPPRSSSSQADRCSHRHRQQATSGLFQKSGVLVWHFYLFFFLLASLFKSCNAACYAWLAAARMRTSARAMPGVTICKGSSPLAASYSELDQSSCEQVRNWGLQAGRLDLVGLATDFWEANDGEAAMTTPQKEENEYAGAHVDHSITPLNTSSLKLMDLISDCGYVCTSSDSRRVERWQGTIHA